MSEETQTFTDQNGNSIEFNRTDVLKVFEEDIKITSGKLHGTDYDVLYKDKQFGPKAIMRSIAYNKNKKIGVFGSTDTLRQKFVNLGFKIVPSETKIDEYFKSVEKDKFEYFKNNQITINDIDNIDDIVINKLHSPAWAPWIWKTSNFRFLVGFHNEKFKEILKDLYNENLDLEKRIHDFRDNVKKILLEDNKWNKKEYADPGIESATFFLSLFDYKKYLLFTRINPFVVYSEKYHLNLHKLNNEKMYCNYIKYCKDFLIPFLNYHTKNDNTLLNCQDFIWFLWKSPYQYREDIIKYFKDKKLEVKDTEEYTSLYKDIIIAKIDKISSRTKEKKFKIYVKFDALDEEYKKDVKKVSDSDEQTLNAEFEVKTFENFEKSIEIIDSALRNSDGNKNKVNTNGDNNMDKQPLNQILYGPPGTGKTYNTIVKAMSIIKNAKLEYNKENKIYEDKLNNKNYTYKELEEEFNNLCSCNICSPTIDEYIEWFEENKYKPTKENPTTDTIQSYKKELLKWQKEGYDLMQVTNEEELEKYREKLFAEFDKRELKDRNWVTTLTQPYNYLEFYKLFNKRIEFITFHQSYSYEEFVEGIKPEIDWDDEKNGEQTNSKNKNKKKEISFIGKKGIFRTLCERAKKYGKNNYVLIIDEINRGNISKIFGELITLIEEDKRENVNGDSPEKYHTIRVTLPYSNHPFTVPNNLYIIGTMNTADRSIALLDTALRRRFEFEEMPPRPELLEGKYVDVSINGENKRIDLQTLLEKLNENIYKSDIGGLDKDHKIGHAFLINVDKADKEDEKVENLRRAFLHKIYPLLEEYFYDDDKKIKDVLGNPKDVDWEKLYNDNKEWLKIVDHLAGNKIENNQ